MRNFELEKYFYDDLYLVRFNNIQDLEKRLKEDEDLKVLEVIMIMIFQIMN